MIQRKQIFLLSLICGLTFLAQAGGLVKTSLAPTDGVNANQPIPDDLGVAFNDAEFRSECGEVCLVVTCLGTVCCFAECGYKLSIPFVIGSKLANIVALLGYCHTQRELTDLEEEIEKFEKRKKDKQQKVL